MKWYSVAAILTSAVLVGGFTTIAGGPAAGDVPPHGPTTLYVAPTTGRYALSIRCQRAAYTDINAAIEAAVAGDTVVVCPGTYTGSVSIATSSVTQPTITTGAEINKSIDLVGMDGAVIDATGLDNGITIYDASNARLTGFTITGAFGEGVFAMVSTGITIRGNLVKSNDVGSASSGYAECDTSAGLLSDCGFGVHLLSVTDSKVLDNTVESNSGGILLTDEYGPTYGNSVSGNLVEDNKTYSGIKLSGHIGTALNALGARTTIMGGVYDNTISNNVIVSNGTAGDGGGILLTAEVRGGGSYDNLVTGNVIDSNGLGGVTIRKLYGLSDVSGNVIAKNRIGDNNIVGDPEDGLTTGVLVGRDSPLFPPVSVTVCDNTIAFDHFGIFDNAGASSLTRFGNQYKKVVVPVRA
ncbi:MAG: nitrous oxide reductase family maturation protein NosD [Acidimicrobiales bacterium]